MPLYLDYNATTPVDPRVLEEMIRVYREDFGNAGSRTHTFGQQASKLVDTARSSVANLLGVQKSEVVFTSGATEADNMAILGLAKWGKENGKRHIISTPIEHKAVLEPLEYLQRQGFEIELVSVGRGGRVEAHEVVQRVRPDTLLVSIMHANNETGAIQPVNEIGAFLVGTETYFHVDAAQTCGKLVDDLKGLQYDFLSVCAHKMYGPQGIGALIVKRRGVRRPPLQPLTYGGGQEAGLRPGTLPVALVVGFGKAAEIALKEHKIWWNNFARVRDSILEQLSAVKYELNGDLDHMMPNCLNVSFTGLDSEALMLRIQDQIAVSNGSACTSADYRPSHVLVAMGLEEVRLEGAVRLSWGKTETPVDLTPLIQTVAQSL